MIPIALALPLSVFAQDPARIAAEVELSTRNCLACHFASEAVEARIGTTPAPRLDAVGARLAPSALRAMLEDPHAVKPGSTMPDVLAGHPERERAIDELVHFLASRGGPFDATPVSFSNADLVEEGRTLFHTIGCVACHGPQETRMQLETPWDEVDDWIWDPVEIDEDRFVPDGVLEPPNLALGELAERTNLESLTAFLLDPREVRPSGRMPHMGLVESEARSIALYLLRRQLVGEGTRLEGLAYEYFEGAFGPEALFGKAVPVRTGSVTRLDELPENRGEDFGIRYRGGLEVAQSGTYEFRLRSDDGSRLWIDGELLIKNDGTHPPTTKETEVVLDAGLHTIQITFFERGGGEELVLRWAGPGFSERVVEPEVLSHRPATFAPPADTLEVDETKRAAGERRFRELGCASCHEPDQRERSAPALDVLDPTKGCLDPASAPRHALDEDELESLRALLGDLASLESEPTAAHELATTLERYQCLVCHARDGRGSPHPDIKDWFEVASDVDLGDQGRIPPVLTQVGRKLTAHWMDEVLFEGGTSRPYMKTRMPQFGREAIGHVPELFVTLDEIARDEEPLVSGASIETGRKLVGTSGLGCIQCHQFNGFESLGVPAVDLAVVTDHVRPQWFHELLMDPSGIDMNARMPAFWEDGKSPVKDVLDGDPEAQIAAIWSFLELGDAMPLPDGLVVPAGTYELYPRGEPITAGVFMRDVSPRTVVVGTPAHVHYAFDVENSRLAKVWRGRFFNARGTWHGRAGALEVPPSEDALDLPETMGFVLAPPLTLLDGKVTYDRPEPRVLGRRFDGDRFPVFRYSVGDCTIEETTRPIERDGATGVRRELKISRPGGSKDIPVFCLGGAEGVEVERELSSLSLAKDGVRMRISSHQGGMGHLFHRRDKTADGEFLFCNLSHLGFAETDRDLEATLVLEITW